MNVPVFFLSVCFLLKYLYQKMQDPSQWDTPLPVQRIKGFAGTFDRKALCVRSPCD